MRTTFQAIAMVVLALNLSVPGQDQTNKITQTDETIRITTALVETGVIVFDKQGRFVDGLKPAEFELRVDGKPQPISFFERVVTGSVAEEKAQAAAREGLTNPSKPLPIGTVARRTLIFFIDDFHLSAASVERVRKSILKFIDSEMAINDQVLVASATGQIGFLSQLTDNKAVLRAAIGRLSYRQYTPRDGESIPMTEYQAIRISKGDRDAIGYFVIQLQQATDYRNAGGQLGPPAGGVGVTGQRAAQGNTGTASPSNQRYEAQVRRRAENILTQSMDITSNTLRSLQNLTRESRQLAGSKLVFFISDGFFLIDNKSGAGYHLQQITDAAARSGVVIYSLDARGMTNYTDASSNRSDPTGQLSRANAGELSVSQDAMAALADDTGGRALFNSDALGAAVTNALMETSSYYLLAWKPQSEEQRGGMFKRLEVSVTGRPDLTIRLPRGYLDGEAKAEQERVETKARKEVASLKPETPKSPADIELRSALGAFAAKRGLGTLLATSFIDTPNNGSIVIASTQIDASGLGFGDDAKQSASVDLAGVILNDQGKPADAFKTNLNVKPGNVNATRSNTDKVVYTYRAPVSPGLYQVRVAARDGKTGRIGSAMQWIEIPDLKSRRLTLSTILLSSQDKGAEAKLTGPGVEMELSVDRRFRRMSGMRILAFIYNAKAGASNASDLLGQMQVIRDGRAVISSPQRKISTDGVDDLGRIPFGGDLNLSSLPEGNYLLQITITDNVAHTTASQRVSFEVW